MRINHYIVIDGTIVIIMNEKNKKNKTYSRCTNRDNITRQKKSKCISFYIITIL